MEESSHVLIGIEAGLLRGLESLRWTLENLQSFSEILAVSTIVQTNEGPNVAHLRVVLKLLTNLTPDQIIQELQLIEQKYDEALRVIEPIRCFLMGYEQFVVITPSVTLPHPVMLSDSSWLFCAWEVWRSYQHPVMNQTLDRLMSQANVTNVDFYSQGKTIVTKTYL